MGKLRKFGFTGNALRWFESYLEDKMPCMYEIGLPSVEVEIHK